MTPDAQIDLPRSARPAVKAVLREVARLLVGLAADPTLNEAIDLSSLPLNEEDVTQLRHCLGQGEVEATLTLGGPSLLAETAYAGVWWVRHADAEGRTMLAQIVVARVPALLLAHPADIDTAARQLESELAAGNPPGERDV